MILGVMSDTHGQAARAAAAVALFAELGTGAVVHCGDVCGDRVIDALAGATAAFVWGNCDAPDPVVAQYAQSVGVTPPSGIPMMLAHADRRIAVFHGHESEFDRALRAAQSASGEMALQADYVLSGHSHIAHDVQIGGIRWINPGALHRAETFTVATIDLVHDVVEHWVVEDVREPGKSPLRYSLPGRSGI